MASPPFEIREAVAGDGPAIRALVREAQLNPRDLDWRRFLVAEADGVVIACAQVRVHGRGTRELASVAVAPAERGCGVGRAIAGAAVTREPARPLYLYTESRTEAFWAKLGFGRVEAGAVPRDMRGPLRVARVATAVLSVVTRERYSIVIMRRDEP